MEDSAEDGILSSVQTHAEDAELGDVASAASEHSPTEAEDASSAQANAEGEDTDEVAAMKDSAKEIIVSSVQTIFEDLGFGEVDAAAAMECYGEGDASSDQAEGDEGLSLGEAAAAVKDSTKEQIIASIQAAEDDEGAGEVLTSIFEVFTDNGKEDGPLEEVELSTGQTLAVVSDAEIAGSPNHVIGADRQLVHCYCCCLKCATFFAIAVVFIGPVVAIFPKILEYFVEGIDEWAELQAIPYPQVCQYYPPTTFTTTWTPWTWTGTPWPFFTELPNFTPMMTPWPFLTEPPTFTTPTDTSGDSPFQAVLDTYDNLFGLFGIISSVAIVVINYRLTAVIGACISGLGCLVAYFVPQNHHLLSFVLGALPAIGNNLLVTSLKVAILEHFRERSTKLLSAVDMSQSIITVLFVVFKYFIFPLAGVAIHNRNLLLLYQAGTYVICMAGAVALRPLNLHMKDDPGQKVRGRILNIGSLQILKSPILYCLSAIFLFDSLGADTPKAYIKESSGTSILSELLAICMSCGEILGAIIACFLPTKKLSLVVSLVMIAVCEFLMGVFTFTVRAVFDDYFYAIGYSATFGALSGLRKPLLQLIIPLAISEADLALAVGLTSFAEGLGSIVGSESAAAIVTDYDRTDAVFYLAAPCFLLSSAACLLIIIKQVKARKEISISTKDEEEGGCTKWKGENNGGDAASKQEQIEIFTVQSQTETETISI